jgi:prepilin-type N-terminal cleavage/methylation domain-containing protein
MFISTKTKTFTLVELLVVIAIVGLLSTIVLAVTSGVSDQGRIAKGLQFSKHLENGLGAYLVGRWTFDETASLCGASRVCDTSGWNNYGTINGADYSDDTVSGNGHSLSFNGSSDYVELEKLPDAVSHTIEVWIKTDVVLSGDGHRIFSMARAADYSKMILWRSNDKVQFWWYDASGVVKTINSLSSINNDSWQHIVATHSGTEAGLFINGARESGNSSTSLTTLVYSDKERIGRGTGTITNYFQGLIDEVRVYSTALTASQVQSHYYAGLNRLLTNGLINKQEYQQKLAKR